MKKKKTESVSCGPRLYLPKRTAPALVKLAGIYIFTFFEKFRTSWVKARIYLEIRIDSFIEIK
jgi:hypothetical protein